MEQPISMLQHSRCVSESLAKKLCASDVSTIFTTENAVFQKSSKVMWCIVSNVQDVQLAMSSKLFAIYPSGFGNVFGDLHLWVNAECGKDMKTVTAKVILYVSRFQQTFNTGNAFYHAGKICSELARRISTEGIDFALLVVLASC